MNSSAATGLVQFLDVSSEAAVEPIASGTFVSSVTVPVTGLGPHSFRAIYRGDLDFEASISQTLGHSVIATTFDSQPVPAAVCPGASATLSAPATGSGVAYRWRTLPPSGTHVIEVTATNVTTGGNRSAYDTLALPSYVILPGDYLEYDIAIGGESAEIRAAIDLIDSSGSWRLRSSGAFDQNGLSASPDQDLTDRADNRFYHRRISLASGVGRTVDVLLGFESNLIGSFRVAVSNIAFTNGALSIPVYNGSSGWTFAPDTRDSATAGYSIAPGSNPPGFLLAADAPGTGALGATYETPLLDADNSGNRYRAEIMDACLVRVASSTVAVSVLSRPVISGASSGCDSVLLSATPGFASYEWSRGGVPIFGATAATYLATLDGSYSVTVVGGCESASLPFAFDVTTSPLSVGLIGHATRNGDDLLIDWTLLEGADSYKVWSDTLPGGSFTTLVGSAAGTLNGIQVSLGSQAPTTYYKIQPFNGSCGGPKD